MNTWFYSLFQSTFSHCPCAPRPQAMISSALLNSACFYRLVDLNKRTFFQFTSFGWSISLFLPQLQNCMSQMPLAGWLCSYSLIPVTHAETGYQSREAETAENTLITVLTLFKLSHMVWEAKHTRHREAAHAEIKSLGINPINTPSSANTN